MENKQAKKKEKAISCRSEDVNFGVEWLGSWKAHIEEFWLITKIGISTGNQSNMTLGFH